MVSNPQKNDKKKDSPGEKPKRSSPNRIRSEGRFAVFDNILEGVQILGNDWRYIYLNAAAEIHNRRPNRELLGNRYMDMWPSIEETHVFSVIERCLKERVPSQLENRFVYPDERVGWFTLSIQPIPEGVLIMSFDITERVQTETALRESEENLRVAVKNSSFILAQVDRDLRYRWIYNPHPDFDPSQVIGKRDDELDDSESARQLTSLKQQVIESGEGVREEISFHRSDGKYTYDFTIEPLYDENGSLIGATSAALDITERVQAEEQIKQLKRLYATLSQVNQTIVRVKDVDELYQSICNVAVKFGEFSLAWIGLLDEASGEVRPVAANGLDVSEWPFPFVNFRSGDLKDGLIATAIRTSKVVTSEDIQANQSLKNLYTQFQKYVYHSAAAVPFRLNGETIGVLSLVSPEKGLFKAEQEMQLLEEMGLDISFALDTMEKEKIMRQWADAFEHCAHGMAIGIPETNHILTCNPAFARSLGRTIEETAGMPILDIYLPEDHERIKQSVAKADYTGQAQFESHMIGKDGRVFPVQMDLVSVRGKNGELLYRVVTQQDITKRKQTEEKLQASERTLKLFVEYAPAAIAMFDRDMKYVAASKRFIEDYRLKDQEIIGRSHYEIFPEITERWKEIHRRCLAGATESAEEDPFPRTDGTLDWVRWEVHPWFEQSGEIGGIILFSEVITDRKHYQQELQSLNTELEQRVANRTQELVQTNIELEHANRAKDEFLATMSHELRTPLNSILGLSESLLEQRRGMLNEHQQRSLQTIESSGHHLLELINDVLDLSKIEAGKFDFYPQTVDVDALCRSSLAFVKNQAIRKSIKIERTGDEAGVQIYADPRRLKQILVNLLINAVKFTPKHGKVELQLHTDANNDLVQFSVVDNGIGIASEDLQRLFQPFVQVDSSLNRQFEGTGLGLYLVQKLTDLHGGSVRVESEVGVGSRFTINLPWGQGIIAQERIIESGRQPSVVRKVGKTKPPAFKSSASRLILLAEDNMANILTIGDYLKSQGYQIVVAHDGLEAIEKAETSNPQVILMDIQMPVMDGLEAIRRLRANPRFETTPVIALTALAMRGDRERCLEAGADEYMSKPVGLKALANTIDKLSSRPKK